MSFSEITTAMLLATAPASPPSLSTELPSQSIETISDGGGILVTIPSIDAADAILPMDLGELLANDPNARVSTTSAVESDLLNPTALTSIGSPVPANSASSPTASDIDQTEYDTIIVTARPRAPKSDPMQEINADTFEVVQDVDRALVGPVALTYKDTLPEPIRDGLRNFISNLGEPVVFLNYLLQFKPGKAVETLGRFAINTTIGIGGLIDVGKRPPFNLPNRSNGFANTLGYYGVKPGPFLFLPLVGPTTLRDAFGGGLDLFVLPFAVGKPFNQLAYTLPGGIISSIDSRAEYDEQLNELREGAADPYTAVREHYLQKRQAEIDELHGRIPNKVSPVSEPNELIITPVNPSTQQSSTLEPSPVTIPTVAGSLDSLIVHDISKPTPSNSAIHSDRVPLIVPD